MPSVPSIIHECSTDTLYIYTPPFRHQSHCSILFHQFHQTWPFTGFYRVIPVLLASGVLSLLFTFDTMEHAKKMPANRLQ